MKRLKMAMIGTTGVLVRDQSKPKLRILQVFNQYLERGGEEVWVNEMLRLCDGDFEIQDLRFHSRAWKGRGAPNRLVQALLLWNNPQSRMLLREAVMQHRPDVLIFHNLIPVASLGLYEEAASLGIPVIQFVHNFRPFSISGTLWYKGRIQDAALHGNPWPEILHGAWEGSILKTALLAFYFSLLTKRSVFQSIAKWVAVSDFMKEKFIMAGMPTERVTSLRHCWHTQPTLKTHSENDYYLFLGRLVPEKGISVLLEAWDQLVLRLGNSCPRLIIAGSGAEEARVHQGAARRHKVACVGFVDGEEKDRLIHECRAVIAPSIWWEPMGLIVYEAYDHGRPVLAARSGGLQETVINGSTGYLHEPGDALALADDVIRMEGLGPEGRRIMGAAGHQWLLTHACPHQWRQSLKKIIQDAVACPK